MKETTLINVILDKSGSMFKIAEDTVGMFNNFLEEQKKGLDYAELSLIQFDSFYEKIYIGKPIKKCPPLILGETYKTGSMTALYDAIGKTIDETNKYINSLSRRKIPKKVLFVIITDGEENNSKEFKKDIIKRMIDNQKEIYNWDFIFLGVDIDAYNEGSKFGMSNNKCMNFDKSAQGFSGVGDTISSYTTMYRATGNVKMNVNDHKK